MSDPSFPSPVRPDGPAVALIAGPTASGKSAVALRLAEMTGGVIVNTDASQVYADLAVLTARPPASDLDRAPHRLFGHIDGAEDYSAARWASEARAAIDAIHGDGRLPILVGGTGLYFDTLLHGLAPIPAIDPAIRAAVRALPVSEAWPLLAREDPEGAARLRPGDTSRVARALEVIRSTGRPLSAWQARRAGGIIGAMDIRAAVVMLPRDLLAERAAHRLDLMLEEGALDEVAALVARDLPSDRPVLRALGVAELAAVLAGRMMREEARERILTTTRAYQKRQTTWARNRQRDWPKCSPDEIGGFDTLVHLRPATHG